MNIIWTAQIQSPDHIHDYTIPARVPGCIHADLLRAGLICDPYWRDNNEQLQWIEACDVTYTGTFSLDEVHPDSHLIFRGLDVYASIYCNGVLLGLSDNMHITWDFDVSDVLIVGENQLTVAFRSPIHEVEGAPRRSAAFTCERLYTRRVQCSYGWDWLGRFVTMGIWKPVELIIRHHDYIGDRQDGIYVFTKNINPYSAQIGAVLHFENVTGNAWVKIEIYDPLGKKLWEKTRRILLPNMDETVDISDPMLWFPAGYGEQPLYRMAITTYTDSSLKEMTEVREVDFGIRTVVILEPEDQPDSAEAAMAKKLKETAHLQKWDQNERSSAFWLLVNGVRIFCQGANWVPSEPFPSEENEEKITRLIALAKGAGVNMLRVWGGGVFAPKLLLDACDREGILVTQDFLMACGDYPEENSDFLEQLRKEAKEAALTMRNHPSLVWWSGDNENAVRGDENLESYNGRDAALLAIGPVLKCLDPQRTFLPSSPYGGVPYASGVRGTTHNTQFLGNLFAWVREGNLKNYREYLDTYLNRFTAEQPALGMPFLSSLKKFMTDEDIFGDDSSISEYHTKNNPGLGEITLYGYVERLAQGIFGDFHSGEDRVKKMQQLHCEWIRLSMELFRRHAWYSSGILYWMWNDCWPAANGWSMIDYYGNPKPGYYAFKRCAKPLIASIQLHDEISDAPCTRVYLSYHGSAEQIAVGSCRLYRYHILSGEEDYEYEIPIEIQAGRSEIIFNDEAIPLTCETVLVADIQTDVGSDRAFCLPAGCCYADMAFVDAQPEIVEETEDFIRLQAKETLPFALIDTENVILEENGAFLKKGEIVVYRKLK